jgi:UDP-N-acetylglucosamine 4,6-dehydratase
MQGGTLSSILITGGSGSFGSNFINRILNTSKYERIVLFSRDELKQHELRLKFGNVPQLRYFIGDIRDKDRLVLAMRDIDYVVHAAALKQVETGEYNPMEFIKTNILGSQNVIEAALQNIVKKVIALSTDKASSPINLYGSTKLTADRLFISSNNYVGNRDTKFSVVRYGNVAGSRGSILSLLLQKFNSGLTPTITNRKMTRFWITLEDAVDFVNSCIEEMNGGEIFVPKIPSVHVVDIFSAFGFMNPEETGLRPGEKIHEEMISIHDANLCVEQEEKYIISPAIFDWGFIKPQGTPVAENFYYSSDNNSNFLSIEQIKKQVDLFRAQK